MSAYSSISPLFQYSWHRWCAKIVERDLPWKNSWISKNELMMSPWSCLFILVCFGRAVLGAILFLGAQTSQALSVSRASVLEEFRRNIFCGARNAQVVEESLASRSGQYLPHYGTRILKKNFWAAFGFWNGSRWHHQFKNKKINRWHHRWHHQQKFF